MSYHQFSREDFLPDADPPIVRRYCLHVKPDDEGPLPARCNLAPGHRGDHVSKTGERVGVGNPPVDPCRWPNDEPASEPVVESGSLFEDGAA